MCLLSHIFCDKIKNQNKCRRTTQEQLDCFLTFINQNPDILTGKNTPKNPQLMQDLWESVFSKLNSLAGPTRTPREWKNTLAHWKNQVRSRARKKRTHMLLTGRGGPSNENINPLEERALQVFGKISVTGDKDILKHIHM